MSSLDDLEAKVASGQSFSRSDVERVVARPDLVTVGSLGERARKRLHGDRVTYLRVCELGPADALPAGHHAREVRLVGAPASVDDATNRARAAVQAAAGIPVTGFSLADLLELAAGDLARLSDLAGALRAAGLSAVAEAPLDQFGTPRRAADVIGAVVAAGLPVWRATFTRAPADARLDLLERACAVQAETGALKVLAPLPRVEEADRPSTGYDDVRTIVAARLLCGEIPSIQVDWPLYGPKLAQVAITYGADDIDGIAAIDPPDAGRRRSPREEIERHIHAAFAEPAERDGRFQVVG